MGGDGRRQGRVKSFNVGELCGFIDLDGKLISVHLKDCFSGRPEVGDVVYFDVEADPERGEGQQKAVNVCSRKGLPRRDGNTKASGKSSSKGYGPMWSAPSAPWGAFGGFWGPYSGFGGGPGCYGKGFGGGPGFYSKGFW